MAWPSGRMRSLPVSPRNSPARGKGFTFVCSSPLKSTQGEGGDKKTCRSCNVMYPRITINPHRAQEAAAGRLIPLREARPGTARHSTAQHGPARPAPTPSSGGAALTHMFGDLSSRVTRADDPRPRARPAAPCQHPGQRLRHAAGDRARWGRVARSSWRCRGSGEGGGCQGPPAVPVWPGGGRGRPSILCPSILCPSILSPSILCPSILRRRPRQRLTHGAGSDAAHHSGGAPRRGGSLSGE